MTGICVNGPACVGAGRPSPALDRCPLCRECLAVAARDVAALTLDYRDLAQLLPPGGTAMAARVSGTTTPPIPLDLGVDALQRDIAWTVCAWEPAVRERAGLPAEVTRGVRPGWAVAAAVAVIAPRVDVLASLPPTLCRADGLDAGLVERDGVYAVASLRALHRRARSALGLSRSVVRLPGTCASCGAEALERESGSDWVRCGHCAGRLTADEYRAYVGLAVAQPRATP
jgi:hypothetical protein